MGDISYKPLIQDMRWSFSRIESFDSCKWKWFLHYIREWEEDDLFYNSYGSLIHEIIQLYYTGKLKKEQMPLYFLKNFSERVSGERPAESTVQKYISAGLNYTRNFKPFDLNCVGVEKKIEFSIDGIQFVGFIDFLGEKDNEFYIIDHKSRELKQRSKKLQKTSKDKELDEMLKQLYLYSAGIKQEFGKYPKKLCFNCFRNCEFIEEEFDKNKYDETIQWAIDTIHRIEDTEDFEPNRDPFKCRWLCGLSDRCEYNLEALEEWKRNKLHEG